ncbi:MAG TPA: ribosome biogenesis GTPase Der [Gammaproteobacteria bacterium]|jgi:GTP-binding protein|nr:ribosome biogenesis GTPase Der [Gammaproteobacteria bacterium]HIN43877.1 ribosome biogenesis GTPase Der [Gammaproteobacteria bacterium]
MLPVIALIGRPNVGKSTLFNRLTRSRKALVDDQPGVTRDRIYGMCLQGRLRCLVVDTGGLTTRGGAIEIAVQEQIEHVLGEADALLFLTDGRAGAVPEEFEIAKRLRQSGQKVFVVVNKVEDLEPDIVSAEFNELGLGIPRAVSARTGFGVVDLLMLLETEFPSVEHKPEQSDRPRVALIGRPNVGKSTLTNALLSEKRVIVTDEPGTTRDSIEVALDRFDQPLMLIDTAGVRRRSRVTQSLEKFSVVKTLQAIEDSQVVVHILDGRQGVLEQDLTIAGLIQASGRSVVLVVNKWDGMERRDKNYLRRTLDRRFPFLPEHHTLYISALYGSGVTDVVKSVMAALRSNWIEMPTSRLNAVLREAMTRHAPPLRQGRPVKIKYAHQGGKNPPTVVLHGNMLEQLPANYLRYIASTFGKAFELVGTRVRLELRTSKNPYSAGRRTSGRQKSSRIRGQAR